jgi:hypothetical protein
MAGNVGIAGVSARITETVQGTEQTLACMFDAIERRADSMKSRTASRTDANSGNISTIPASHACGTRQLPNYRTNQSIA